MWSIKRIGMYTNVIILSVFIIGCDSSSNNAENQREDSKEEQIKKSFAKTLDMYLLRISRIYMTKKDIVMVSLKKAIRGRGYCIQLWYYNQKARV